MTCSHPCCVSFGFARSDNICLVGSHVFLEYLSRIIDICTSYTDMHTRTSFVSLVQTHTHTHSHALSSCFITTEQMCSLNYQSQCSSSRSVHLYPIYSSILLDMGLRPSCGGKRNSVFPPIMSSDVGVCGLVDSTIAPTD
jgi:hypothetical protein